MPSYRALLNSGVSGTDHRIHTTKKPCQVCDMAQVGLDVSVDGQTV